MTPRSLLLFPVVAMAAWSVSPSGWAQLDTAAPASAASVRPAVRPTPRLPTAEERREGDSIDTLPTPRVTPQIAIPLKEPSAADKVVAPRDRRNRAASANTGVHDAVARCEAVAGAASRAECRDQMH